MAEEDEELQKLEDELEKLKSLDTSYGSPQPKDKEHILKIFRDILETSDSRKVGNLTESELGKLRLPVRPYFELAAYAESEGLDKVALYLADKAEIISSTSMSKLGFLVKMLVTQIKKEQKIGEPKKKKKKWFGTEEKEESEET